AVQQERRTGGDADKRGGFHVGFNVRTAETSGGEPSIEIEPFGDVVRDAKGEAAVTERREPPADIFDEGDRLLVVVEMPGISRDDASFTIDGDVLTISAERGSKRYHKELLLPRAADQDLLRVCAVNGVFEIVLADGDAPRE
ncbi:MAG: Hsp20/alpha crystallin family protein, partial [Planctomycetota bacterium]